MTDTELARHAGMEAAASPTWRQASCQCRIAMGLMARTKTTPITEILKAWGEGHQRELWLASERQLKEQGSAILEMLEVHGVSHEPRIV